VFNNWVFLAILHTRPNQSSSLILQISKMMMLSSKALAALLLASHGVLAQQVPGNIIPYDNLGLSSACFDAVNSTVSACPA
jgi:hypothetical protein